MGENSNVEYGINSFNMVYFSFHTLLVLAKLI